MAPVEYAGGKRSLGAYIAVVSRYTATRLAVVILIIRPHRTDS